MIATPRLPILSVIIPVRNHAGPLRRLLDRLRNQAIPPDWLVEVIVVDNSSTDHTAAVIKASPFTYVLCTELGSGAARNAGVRASRGSLLYFIDADTLPGSDEQFVTLIQIAMRIGPDRFGAFGGAVVIPPNQRWNPIAIADHWACWFNWHPGRKPQRKQRRTARFEPGGHVRKATGTPLIGPVRRMMHRRSCAVRAGGACRASARAAQLRG